MNSVEEESGSKNPKKGGRPAIYYRARPITHIVESLIERAYFRLIEKHHRVDGKEPALAEINAAWFTALGYPQEEAQIVADSIREEFAQLPKDEGAARRAKRDYLMLCRELKRASQPYAESIPLPIGWSYHAPAQYRAAVLRAMVEAHPGQRRSRRELAHQLGVSEASVTAYMKRACLENIDQFEENRLSVGVRLTLQIKQAEYRCKGRARVLSSVRDGVRREYFFDWLRIDEAQRWVTLEHAAGGEALVRIQVASLQRIVEPCVEVTEEDSHEDCIDQAQSETAPNTEDNSVSSVVPVVHVGAHRPIKRASYYGVGFDPQWVVGQLQVRRMLLDALLNATNIDVP